MSSLPINHRIVIPSTELTVSVSRSGGPGGQHVNTTDTRVRLTFALASSRSIAPAVKQRLREQNKRWATADGDLHITCDETRSQGANLERARQRLADAIRAALMPPKVRKLTRATKASQRRRVDAKKRRAQTKKGRAKVKFGGD